MKFSWKTTLGGIIAVLSGVGDMAQSDWIPGPQAIGLIAGGIALLFGKDHDVSGGKRKQ